MALPRCTHVARRPHCAIGAGACRFARQIIQIPPAAAAAGAAEGRLRVAEVLRSCCLPRGLRTGTAAGWHRGMGGEDGWDGGSPQLVVPGPPSSILHSSSSVFRSLSSIIHPPLSVLHPLSSIIRSPPFVLRPLLSILHHLSSILCPPSSIFRPSSSVLHYPSILCPLSSVLHSSSSIIRPPFSVLHPPSLALGSVAAPFLPVTPCHGSGSPHVPIPVPRRAAVPQLQAETGHNSVHKHRTETPPRSPQPIPSQPHRLAANRLLPPVLPFAPPPATLPPPIAAKQHPSPANRRL